MAFEPEKAVSLAPLTTWRIGGSAEYFGMPKTSDAFIEAVEWGRREGFAITLLGRGSNCLVADCGLRGLTLSTRMLGRDLVVRRGDLLEVSAGYFLPSLAKAVAELGFTGYEFYIGIPGTVGGAVFMNAGFGPTDERQTANRCVEVCLLSTAGEMEWVPYEGLQPRYRQTVLEKTRDIVVAARFRLVEEASPQEIRATTAEHLAMRRQRQPFTRPTAGSVFKADTDQTPAAVWIDKAGLKGFSIGSAMVSRKHANWIENTGSATAAEVRQLIEHVQTTVFERFEVRLFPEVRFLG